MLIIFDLDDTLIDTSGCITYFKLEDALNAMILSGLAIPDFSEGLQLLRKINASAESSRAALSEFVDIHGFDKSFVEIGVKEIHETLPSDLPLFPLDGALELLDSLGQQHQLALVTVGIFSRQMEKLKKAGIDSRIFSKIFVSEEKGKLSHYQTIVDELGYSSSEVLVCGDRVPVDLRPAKELGFKTVQMLWGRGLNSNRTRGDVDYSISKLSELKDIVNDLSFGFVL